MATSDKPQGTKPNKKGGNFVDPLDKWDDSTDDLGGLDDSEPKTKAKLSKEDSARLKAREARAKANKQLSSALFGNIEDNAAKIEALQKQLANPKLSQADKLLLRRELNEANRATKKLSDAATNVADELVKSRRLEAQAYAKLNRLKTWQAQPGNTAGLTPDDLRSIKDTEDSLKDFIRTMNVFRKDTNWKDEDVRKTMVSKLDKLLDRVSSMPEEFQTMFEEDSSRLDEILARQKEAREFVKKQNDQIKKALWTTADKIGFGALNVGNLVRGGLALWNLKKNTKEKANQLAEKFRAGRDYVKQTIEMRQLAKASPIEAEDPSLAPLTTQQAIAEARAKAADRNKPERYEDLSEEKRDRLLKDAERKLRQANPFEDKASMKARAEAQVRSLFNQPTSVETETPRTKEDELRIGEKQTSLMQRYVDGSERFRSRLLASFGKKKDKSEEKEDNGLLKGFRDLFGSGGLLRSLLSAVAKMSAVAIAGAIGYWVGSKIWEKIAPSMAEKFNNISGLNQAGKNVTAPVQLNTQQNFERAQKIHQALKVPGSKVARDDQDWYAQFRFDNQKVDLDKPYSPNDNLKRINKGSQVSPVAPVQPTMPDTGAGAGRGSVSPPMPSTSIAPIQTQPTVSSGSQFMDAWMGKTMTKNGQVDTSGVHPAMQSNMVNMAQEFNEQTGKKLQINSAFRSMEEQEDLYRSKPPGYAARPGSSLHNFGLAVDVSSNQANELKQLGLLDKYGFTRPIKKEPWHMQPVGVSAVAAKAGVYSADAPVDQGGASRPQVAARPQAQTVAEPEARIPVTDSSGGTIQTGSGGSVGTVGGGKRSASDIPTFDTQDGHLLAMNLGVV